MKTLLSRRPRSKDYVALQHHSWRPRILFETLSRTNREMHHWNVPMRSPLEFPDLLLLNLEDDHPWEPLPLFATPSYSSPPGEKKKKKDQFSIRLRPSNRSRSADYFVDYYFSRRHWIVKKKKKNTNSWSSRSRRMRFAIRWLNGNWIIGHDDRSGGSGAHPVWQAGVWKIHRGGGSINVEQRCFLETLSISGGWHPPSPPRSGVP